MVELIDKNAFIVDMDGVIYHGRRLLDGARDFVDWLKSAGKKYLFLTNSPARSPSRLREKLLGLGIDIEEEHFMTSAIATAAFIASQSPGARVYLIGSQGLYEAVEQAGLKVDDERADYVVVGEPRSYNFDKLERAVNLVVGGAKLIGTNPDVTGPTETGIAPACRALISPIEMATGRAAYFIGKPNPLIMRQSLKKLHCRREDTVIVGDRMDTDIIAGIESEIETVLVLSGITKREQIEMYPYRPGHILEGVGELASRVRE
jgi:NagD protein